jgi:hypothetical protein
MTSMSKETIREAIAYTALQADPEVLNAYPYFQPNPTAPAVVVGVEAVDFVGAMGGGMTDEDWRLWILLDQGSDWVEAQRRLDLYLSMTGEKSMNVAFRSPNAYWRTRGLTDIRLIRYSRLPSDIQGPNLLEFNGPTYWGVPLTIQVRYGYS